MKTGRAAERMIAFVLRGHNGLRSMLLPLLKSDHAQSKQSVIHRVVAAAPHVNRRRVTWIIKQILRHDANTRRFIPEVPESVYPDAILQHRKVPDVCLQTRIGIRKTIY